MTFFTLTFKWSLLAEMVPTCVINGDGSIYRAITIFHTQSPPLPLKGRLNYSPNPFMALGSKIYFVLTLLFEK